MRKLILGCICLVMAFTIMQDEARAQLFAPSFEMEKVIGNVYVGKQGVPLEPILDPDYHDTYLTMNLYVIASEDRSEVVLIDAPGSPEFPELFGLPSELESLSIFLEALEAEFPGAEIKGVFLTHDHLDHCWSSTYFAANGIPVYASSAEINAPPGMHNMPLAGLLAIPIEPGFSITLNDGAVITAVDLTGHTPGQMGYAYYPDGDGDKINWFFAGDALMAPLDHGASSDPDDITYFVRWDMLVWDTFGYQLWKENIVALKGMLTKHAKLFPGHGAVREGYLWQDPAGYIDHTVEVLQQFQP